MKVKICGITTEMDGRLVANADANAVGVLVGITHRAEDQVTSDQARAIFDSLPPLVSRVLVTHLGDPEQVEQLARYVGADTIQLHWHITVDAVKQLRRELNGMKLIKAVHAEGDDPLDMARTFAPHVDAIVVDSLNLSENRVGGTGRTHDWTVSARSREVVSIPVILAGGLNPENVAEAIATVRPYAVDVNTGVEADRSTELKDGELVRSFVERAREAARRLRLTPTGDSLFSRSA